jgi:hypothetical protein
MQGRFPAVAARVRQVYGLRLPRHVAVVCALWASASSVERAALNHLGVWPFGLTEYFGDGGLRLTGRDGLDERLHARYRRDPPEFVTVLSGGTDGLHYGLWYDDPADLPSLLVYNYARDDAVTWASSAATMLGEIRRGAQQAVQDFGEDQYDEDVRLILPVFAALDWFADADQSALEADGLPPGAAGNRQSSAVSVFPALPAGCGDPQLARSEERVRAFREGGTAAAQWITLSRDQLAAGKPALALAVGGELHWTDLDQYRQASHDLLAGAYRALGRDALAGIAEVHVAHRDLRSVGVLVPS